MIKEVPSTRIYTGGDPRGVMYSITIPKDVGQAVHQTWGHKQPVWVVYDPVNDEIRVFRTQRKALDFAESLPVEVQEASEGTFNLLPYTTTINEYETFYNIS